MSDHRFDDIVIESNSMIGPEGKYHTAVCKPCSSQHKVTSDEFERTDLNTLVWKEDGYETKPLNEIERNENADEILAYVAEMRAWACCNEGHEPLDGFPDEPEASGINFGEH